MDETLSAVGLLEKELYYGCQDLELRLGDVSFVVVELCGWCIPV